jgi:hypothetical protein
MGAQIPVIEEKPLVVSGCHKFKIDSLGDHLCTCTAHSGAKKDHDWVVDQLADLFRTTHRVKTQQAGPVPLVLDHRLAHDRFDSSSDPTLNGRLRYNDIDKSLNESANDKIRKYRADYNNNPSSTVAFMPAIADTNGRLHSDFIRLLF